MASRLRQMGYEGRLRACGHVIADQYPQARRSGFDEVEISADLARRQLEHQLKLPPNWRAASYQRKILNANCDVQLRMQAEFYRAVLSID